MNTKQTTLKSNLSCKESTFRTLPKAVSAKAAGKCGEPIRKNKVDQPYPPAEVITEIEAKVDVGWGNTLFIRGKGAGLTWDKGTPLSCINGSSWVWLSAASDKVIFKLLLNDQIWAEGEDVMVAAGDRVELKPVFSQGHRNVIPKV